MNPKMKFHYYQVTDERADIIYATAMRTHGIADFDYADCLAALTNKYGDNFTACDDYTLAERVEDYLKCKLSYN